jgi:hypothetical protein
MLKLQNLLIKEGLQFAVLMPQASLITVARNFVVAEFLKNQAFTHLAFIDADVGFEPGVVRQYLQIEKDIVAGIYPVKQAEERAIRSLGPKEPIGAAFHYAVKLLEGEQPGIDGFARAYYAATGFMLIRRRVIEQMIMRYPELKYRQNFNAGVEAGDHHYALFDTSLDHDRGLYLPEDYTFCSRWRAMGGEIWVDTRSRLDHVGTFTFQGDFPSWLNRYAGNPATDG